MRAPGISVEMLDWIGSLPRDVKQHPRFREVLARYDGAMRTEQTRAAIIGEVRSIAHQEAMAGK